MPTHKKENKKPAEFYLTVPTTFFECPDVLQHILSFMNLRVAFDNQGKIKTPDFLSILTCFKAFHLALINYPDFQKRFELMKKLDLGSRISKSPPLFKSLFLFWKTVEIPLASEIFKRDHDLIYDTHNRLKSISITSDQFIMDDEARIVINLHKSFSGCKRRVKIACLSGCHPMSNS